MYIYTHIYIYNIYIHIYIYSLCIYIYMYIYTYIFIYIILSVKMVWYKVKGLSIQYIQHNICLGLKYNNQHCFDYKSDSFNVIQLECITELQEVFVG